MDMNSQSPVSGRIMTANGGVANIVDLLGGVTPISGEVYDIESYTPRSARVIGEDGRLYSLADLLKNLASGSSGSSGGGGSGGSSLVTQPQLWQAGVEYDFGDGTFGRRFVAETGVPHTSYIVSLMETTSDFRIIDCDGFVYFDTFPYNAEMGLIALGHTFMVNGSIRANCSMFAERSPGVQFYNLCLSADTFNTSTSWYRYDVWVRYSK